VKAATRGLHTRAERSGGIADILAGRASPAAVALLLRPTICPKSYARPHLD
jgi:hypothetical protein